MYTVSQLEDLLVFLRHCDFLGDRAASLAKDLAVIVEDHIQACYSFFGEWYPFDEYDWK